MGLSVIAQKIELFNLTIPFLFVLFECWPLFFYDGHIKKSIHSVYILCNLFKNTISNLLPTNNTVISHVWIGKTVEESGHCLEFS